jgi:hypothetical protein
MTFINLIQYIYIYILIDSQTGRLISIGFKSSVNMSNISMKNSKLFD